MYFRIISWIVLLGTFYFIRFTLGAYTYKCTCKKVCDTTEINSKVTCGEFIWCCNKTDIPGELTIQNTSSTKEIGKSPGSNEPSSNDVDIQSNNKVVVLEARPMKQQDTKSESFSKSPNSSPDDKQLTKNEREHPIRDGNSSVHYLNGVVFYKNADPYQNKIDKVKKRLHENHPLGSDSHGKPFPSKIIGTNERTSNFDIYKDRDVPGYYSDIPYDRQLDRLHKRRFSGGFYHTPLPSSFHGKTANHRLFRHSDFNSMDKGSDFNVFENAPNEVELRAHIEYVGDARPEYSKGRRFPQRFHWRKEVEPPLGFRPRPEIHRDHGHNRHFPLRNRMKNIIRTEIIPYPSEDNGLPLPEIDLKSGIVKSLLSDDNELRHRLPFSHFNPRPIKPWLSTKTSRRYQLSKHAQPFITNYHRQKFKI